MQVINIEGVGQWCSHHHRMLHSTAQSSRGWATRGHKGGSAPSGWLQQLAHRSAVSSAICCGSGSSQANDGVANPPFVLQILGVLLHAGHLVPRGPGPTRYVRLCALLQAAVLSLWLACCVLPKPVSCCDIRIFAALQRLHMVLMPNGELMFFTICSQGVTCRQRTHIVKPETVHQQGFWRFGMSLQHYDTTPCSM